MISSADRAFVAALCAAHAGLRVDPEKAYLIESRAGSLARREGFASPQALIAVVREGADPRLAAGLVEAMVLPETDFFRDPVVFTRLVAEVLPDLARRREGPVRVWSAGCGAGQEIYSLAMLLDEAPALAARVELHASDLSERSLEKAQAGLYSQFEVQRGLPARLLVRHFEKSGDSFVLSPRIRQMIRWRRANLLENQSRFGPFDLVLCRNVLGRASPEARDRLLAHLHGALAAGGRLVAGMEEVVGGPFACVLPSLGLHADVDAARAAA